MCSKYAYPFCIYSHGKISTELWQFLRNSLLAWNVTTLHLGYAQEWKNKETKLREEYVHTTPPVLCFCGWAQLFNFNRDLAHASVFTAHTTGNTTLLANKQLQEHSPDSRTFVSCFTQTVHLLHKHTLITFHLTQFNIIHCRTMFLNITPLIITLSFSVMRKWKLLLALSPLSLILYV
jgi:hypothetical protein